MKWLKSNLSNILFLAFIALLLIPQTGRPIKIYIQQLIATSPTLQNQSELTQVNFRDWQIKDKDEKLLKPLKKLDKPIIINFWATWCPPCIAEMPSFANTYNEFKDDVDFYFVSNESWEEIHAFENKRNFNLPYYQYTENHPQWEVNTIPRTLVINKNAEVVIDESGVARWDSDSFKNLLITLSN